ncbi:GIY-YIG nuclease family protein [Thiolapillus sp.]
MKSGPSYPAEHISYQLRIRIHQDIRIVAGALGCCNFTAGDYVYTGSARRNLAARIRRHLSDSKKLRWHIDYLLIHPAVEITHVKTSAIPECRWNQQLSGEIPIPGFGASDCRRHCGAHLKKAPR